MKRQVIEWMYGIENMDEHDRATRVNYLLNHTPEVCLSVLLQLRANHTPLFNEARDRYRDCLLKNGVTDSFVLKF